MTRLSSAVHASKAWLPMLVTEAGMVRLVTPRARMKAPLPIVVRPAWRVTRSSAQQSPKAEVGIVATPPGISISSSE